MSESEYRAWTDWENDRLAELRAEVSKPITNVKAHVAREREKARRTSGQDRVPRPWAQAAAAEQAEEAATLAAYAAALAHVREWLDGHIAARLAGRGRKAPASGWLPLTPAANACRRTCAATASALIPALWADRVTRDVLLAWKAGELEDDDQAQAAQPTTSGTTEQRRGA